MNASIFPEEFYS